MYNKENPWTDREINLLTTNITLETEELLKLFPTRSKMSVLSKKNRINKSNFSGDMPKQKAKRANEWTQKEDNILLNNTHLGDKEIYKLLPNRTPSAIHRRRFRIASVSDQELDSKNKQTKMEKSSPSNLTDEIETLEIIHNRKVKELQDSHFQNIRGLERKHSTLLTNLKHDHRAKINASEKEYIVELKRLESDNQEEYKELSRDYNHKLANLEYHHKEAISGLKQKQGLSEKEIIKSVRRTPVLEITDLPVPKLEEIDEIEDSVSLTYNKAVEEFKEIYKTINEPSLSNDKHLIIGEVLYLISSEKDIRRKNDIEKGIIRALMTKSRKYWDTGRSLKLCEWMDRLQSLGEKVDFADTINLAI